jgi:hypothetical protein
MAEVPHPALLRYLASLCDAVLARDQIAVQALLGRAVASHLPRAVREEAVAHSRLERTDLRAPIRLLRFQHRMTELVRLSPPVQGAQLELALRRTHEEEYARAVRKSGSTRAAARERPSEPAKREAPNGD